MAQEIIDLQIEGDTNLDLFAGGNTDPISLTRAYTSFSLQVKYTGTPIADPIIWLEGSNDGSTWSNMYSNVTDASIGDVNPIKVLVTSFFSDTANGVNSVSGGNPPFKYFRMVLDPNGGFNGFMQAKLNLELEDE